MSMRGIWATDFFSYNIFVWFWYQVNTVLDKGIRKYSAASIIWKIFHRIDILSNRSVW